MKRNIKWGGSSLGFALTEVLAAVFCLSILGLVMAVGMRLCYRLQDRAVQLDQQLYQLEMEVADNGEPDQREVIWLSDQSGELNWKVTLNYFQNGDWQLPIIDGGLK